MSYIDTTGNNHTDIASIMEQLNRINDSTGNPQALNLATYGIIAINYTGGPQFNDYTVNHNLGYIPFFIVRYLYSVNGVTKQFSDITNLSFYSYNGGIKSMGTYPGFTVFFTATSNVITVSANIPTAPVYPANGLYLFQYYCFSYPIARK